MIKSGVCNNWSKYFCFLIFLTASCMLINFLLTNSRRIYKNKCCFYQNWWCKLQIFLLINHRYHCWNFRYQRILDHCLSECDNMLVNDLHSFYRNDFDDIFETIQMSWNNLWILFISLLIERFFKWLNILIHRRKIESR